MCYVIQICDYKVYLSIKYAQFTCNLRTYLLVGVFMQSLFESNMKHLDFNSSNAIYMPIDFLLYFIPQMQTQH